MANILRREDEQEHHNIVVEWGILTWCQVEAGCSRLWHYRKTPPATVRKFLASLRLCNLLVNHHGDIGCWKYWVVRQSVFNVDGDRGVSP